MINLSKDAMTSAKRLAGLRSNWPSAFKSNAIFIRTQSQITARPGPDGGFKKGPWLVGGLAIYAFTAYGTYLYSSYQAAVVESEKLDVPMDVADRYDSTAQTFDRDIEMMEWSMGMGRLRRKLAQKAYGDVLEVSAGTGRNLEYYPLSKCASLLLVDKSGPMVDQVRQRISRSKAKYERVQVSVQDILQPSQVRKPAGYDTIVQTMGLCSTHEPVQLLKTLGSLAKQETGQILLLEHGRSHYRWLDRILDSLAKAHANKHGCWWNRDIGRIVEESGLDIVAMKRYHLGTTWWIELRPARAGKASAAAAEAKQPS